MERTAKPAGTRAARPPRAGLRSFAALMACSSAFCTLLILVVSGLTRNSAIQLVPVLLISLTGLAIGLALLSCQNDRWLRILACHKTWRRILFLFSTSVLAAGFLFALFGVAEMTNLPLAPVLVCISLVLVLAVRYSFHHSEKLRATYVATIVTSFSRRGFFSLKRWMILAVGLTFLLPMAVITVFWQAVVWNFEPQLFYWLLATAALLLTITVWWITGKLIDRKVQFAVSHLLLTFFLFSLFLATAGRWFVGVSHREIAIRRLEAAGGTIQPYARRRFDNELLSYQPGEPVHEIQVDTNRALTTLLRQQPSFQEVEFLTLGKQVTEISPASAEALNKFGNLKGLQLLQTGLEDNHIRNLNAWHGGSTIWVIDCDNLTKRAWDEIAEMEHIVNLGIVHNQTPSQIRESDFRKVIGGEHLRSVSLYQVTTVTDKSVPTLARMKNLEYLRLDRTGISPQGRAELYAALPDCHILTHISTDSIRNVERIEIRSSHEPVAGTLQRHVQDQDTIDALWRLFQNPLNSFIVYDKKSSIPEGIRLDFRGRSRILFTIVVGEDAIYYDMGSPIPMKEYWAELDPTVFDRSEFMQTIGFD